MFEGEKMLIHDEKGSRLDAGCCVALIASLILTVKDVYKFSESLSLCDDSAPPGEQLLQMTDCRTAETRAIYYAAIRDFMVFTVDQDWINQYAIPAAHMATVLLHIHKERETMWTSCAEPKDATLIPSLKKDKTPVLITNAIHHGIFISYGKAIIKD